MKRLSILLFAFLFFLPSCGTMKQLGLAPTSFETISAVREVLNGSAFKAIRTLQKLNKSGVAGLLPEQLQPVLGTMKTLGLGKEIETITKQIGNISGKVASESGGIMKDAIKEVKFDDAVAIVLGGENAATQVLKQAMYGSVKKRYSSQLDSELAKTDALQYWPMAAGAYNLFAKKKVDGKLSDFIAERSVDALFLTMGKEESKIRKDPKSLGKNVVTKVFDYYAKNKK